MLEENEINFEAKFEEVEHQENCQYDAENSCLNDEYPNNPLSTLMSILNSLTRIAFRAVNNFP